MNRELAYLLSGLDGWSLGHIASGQTIRILRTDTWWIVTHLESEPAFLIEVYRELKEQGLWDEFFDAWVEIDGPFHRDVADAVGKFVNDPQGQIEAAVKVLKEQREVDGGYST